MIENIQQTALLVLASLVIFILVAVHLNLRRWEGMIVLYSFVYSILTFVITTLIRIWS